MSIHLIENYEISLQTKHSHNVIPLFKSLQQFRFPTSQIKQKFLIHVFTNYLSHMYLLSTGEPEVNPMDKFPALVKITVFSTGKKTHFFLALSFPNICSLLQLNETQVPEYITCLHICAFSCTIFSLGTRASLTPSASQASSTAVTFCPPGQIFGSLASEFSKW